MKKLSLLVFTLFTAVLSYGSHFTGGEIRYEFNGTNYDVYLSVYKICENPSASLPNTAFVKLSSLSQSYSSNIQMTFLGYDTVNINCPNTFSSCTNPTGMVPGYITSYFKGTATLPGAASDWVLSYTNGARIAGLMNLGVGSSTMYLYANIDNSTSINSTPLIASSPTYYVPTSTAVSFPLQGIDAEGDLLQYDFVSPMTAANTNVTYNTGYSLTSPLGTGGTATINNTTNIMTLNAPNTGKFALAIRVREYRNSVLVGEYIREFAITALQASGTLNLTTPAPASNTVYTYFTCPGQTNNSISLNFTDPTSTDSVYLDVTTPNMTGWSFNVNNTPGIPTANTTITWTTPSNLNPATLPHFYIRIKARDNACPRSVGEYAVIVRTRQCVADSVWPGDANGDYTVNIYDPLAIAIANGQTGAVRAGATTNWTAQWCANWANVFVTNNVNMKHADCNGDGTVNNSDLTAITANYSKTHPKGGRAKTTGIDDLYFDVTGVTIAPGKTVKIPIKLGGSNQTISNTYGIATEIHTDGVVLATAPSVDITNSWIDNSGGAINFDHEMSKNVIGWAHSRTNHTNTSGQGTIGELTFTVPTTAKVGDKMNFWFEGPVLIDKDGKTSVDFNATDATLTVQQPESVEGIAGGIQSVSVVPNPSGNSAYLTVNTDNNADVSVSVTDITGKIIWTHSAEQNSQHQISLPASRLSSGLYMIRVSAADNAPALVKWIKQ